MKHDINAALPAWMRLAIQARADREMMWHLVEFKQVETFAFSHYRDKSYDAAFMVGCLLPEATVPRIIDIDDELVQGFEQGQDIGRPSNRRELAIA